MANHARVMVVDDDATTRDLLRKLLRNRGCFPLVAHGGFVAFMLASSDPPDVVLVDYDLKGMTGADLIRLFKTHPKLMNVPVIAFNDARTTDTSTFLLKDAGAVEVVSKPFNAATIMALILKYVKCEVC